MFSATIPPKIEKMAAELMSSPLCISVGVVGASSRGLHSLLHPPLLPPPLPPPPPSPEPPASQSSTL